MSDGMFERESITQGFHPAPINSWIAWNWKWGTGKSLGAQAAWQWPANGNVAESFASQPTIFTFLDKLGLELQSARETRVALSRIKCLIL